jgi:serine/threonine protein kinase
MHPPLPTSHLSRAPVSEYHLRDAGVALRRNFLWPRGRHMGACVHPRCACNVQCDMRIIIFAVDRRALTKSFYPLCYPRKQTVHVVLICFGCVAGEIWMQVESMCNPSAAACISSGRGDGLLEEATAATCSTVGFPSTTATDLKDAAFTRCSVFHGAAGDGAQLMHIINILGVPTPTDVDTLTLQVPPHCKGLLTTLFSLIDSKPSDSRACRGLALPMPPVQDGTACPLVQPLNIVEFLTRKYIPIDVAHLISRMLAWNPVRRLSAAHALLHPALLIPWVTEE